MPLFWLSLAFLTGLVLGGAVLSPFGAWWGWVVLALLPLGLAFFERRLLGRFGRYARARTYLHLPLGLLLAAALLGLARQAAAAPDFGPGDLAFYNGAGTYRIQGLVSEPPALGQRSQQIEVQVEQITPLDASGQAGTPFAAGGRLLAALAQGESAYRYGDRLELEGLPVAPAAIESPEYAAYLARNGVYTLLNYPHSRLLVHDAGSPLLAFLYNLRMQARTTLQAILPMPESALLTGILLGIGDDMPASVIQDFQVTGTAHIWAISGFNIAILSGLVLTFFGRLLPRRRLAAAGLAAGTVAAYTLLVGASPSVVRSALMGGLGMGGMLLGRRQAGLNSLTFTAAVMALFEPSMPWNVSFQLSFLATLGLVVFGEPLQAGFQGLLARRLGADWARRIAGPVGEYFLLTLAAQAVTLPVTVLSFGRFSLSAVLANPLVLPIQPAVMILGGLALLCGLVFLPLGQLLGALAWPTLAYTLRVVELLASIPGGVVNVAGQVSPLLAGVWYLGLGAWAAGLRWTGPLRRWLRPAVLLLGAGLLAALAWRAALSAPDGRLHLLALESGGPPAVLVQAPDGRCLLINGGGDASRLATELGRRLPPGSPSLAAWLVSARSSAPLQAILDLSGQFSLGQVVLSTQAPTSTTGTHLKAFLEQARVEVGAFVPGQQLDLGGGVRLSVLADTIDGTALLLEWGSFRAFIPSGVALKKLDAGDLAGVSALVLGPADLEGPAAADWQALTANVVLWSRPGPALELPGWQSLPARGWVELVTDGQTMWAEGGPP